MRKKRDFDFLNKVFVMKTIPNGRSKAKNHFVLFSNGIRLSWEIYDFCFAETDSQPFFMQFENGIARHDILANHNLLKDVINKREDKFYDACYKKYLTGIKVETAISTMLSGSRYISPSNSRLIPRGLLNLIELQVKRIDLGLNLIVTRADLSAAELELVYKTT